MRLDCAREPIESKESHGGPGWNASSFSALWSPLKVLHREVREEGTRLQVPAAGVHPVEDCGSYDPTPKSL